MPGLFVHLLNAFLLTVLLIMILRTHAAQLMLVDLPDLRKRHEGATPVCGGLAIFLAVMITNLGLPEPFAMAWNVQVALGLLVLLGMADDLWHLPATTRLGLQMGAAAILITFMGGAIVNVATPVLLADWQVPAVLATAVALFFLVGTINAVNMLDGIDGLAGASIAAALFWIALLAVHAGDIPVMVHALVILAAVLGFLTFNMRHRWRSRASIFMGDAGSIVLGAVLAYFVLELASGPGGISFAVLLWVLVIPIVDTLSLIVRRLAAGHSPFAPDRRHMHHLLVDNGVSATLAAAILTGATALCGGIGYVGVVAGLPDTLMAAGLAVPVIVHTAFVIVASGHSPGLAALSDMEPSPLGQPSFPSIVGDDQ